MEKRFFSKDKLFFHGQIRFLYVIIVFSTEKYIFPWKNIFLHNHCFLRALKGCLIPSYPGPPRPLRLRAGPTELKSWSVGSLGFPAPGSLGYLWGPTAVGAHWGSTSFLCLLLLIISGLSDCQIGRRFT